MGSRTDFFAPPPPPQLEAIKVEIQNKLVVEHVVTYVVSLACLFKLQTLKSRREKNRARIKLNDDSCADESRDEALKDCFVEARE